MIICAHALIKNEENYIWYAINSVIAWVDKVLVWDTGSSDNTVGIVKEIQKVHPGKISFFEYGDISAKEYWKPRDEMLKNTKADWIITLDGDEVWWEDSIKQLVKLVIRKGNKYESIIVRVVNLVGDIYHCQEELAGRYEFKGKKGHYNLRAFSSKIPGLNARGEHGKMGYFDSDGKSIQERKETHFLDVSYMHFTHMPRTVTFAKDLEVPKRAKKLKYEIGQSFPKDFYYPEVFFRQTPLRIPSVWKKMSRKYIFRALLETPFKMVKRRTIYK